MTDEMLQNEEEFLRQGPVVCTSFGHSLEPETLTANAWPLTVLSGGGCGGGVLKSPLTNHGASASNV